MVRLREIKPNEVICCKTIEEMQELFSYTENAHCCETVSAIWNYDSYDENRGKRRNCISFNKKGKRDGFCYREYYENKGLPITEFSDLIIPELSAEEVLRICNDICTGIGCVECPMRDNCYSSGFADYKKVVEICEQWKADHEKKEPELEWVDICRIIEIQNNGFKKCVHEEDLFVLDSQIAMPASVRADKTEEVLKNYIFSHDGNYIAVVERVCRVKK